MNKFISVNSLQHYKEIFKNYILFEFLQILWSIKCTLPTIFLFLLLSPKTKKARQYSRWLMFIICYIFNKSWHNRFQLHHHSMQRFHVLLHIAFLSKSSSTNIACMRLLPSMRFNMDAQCIPATECFITMHALVLSNPSM